MKVSFDGGFMFKTGKITSVLSFTLFTFLILSYQNCAKPLEEIGSNSSLVITETGSCEINVSKTHVTVSDTQNVTYSYYPASLRFRVVVVNNTSGASAENVYYQAGSIDLPYNNENMVGSYTIYGIVENNQGLASGSCQQNYVVQTSGVNPDPDPDPDPTPTPPTPSITLSGTPSSCVGSCNVNITHNASNIAGSGKVYRIVKQNGNNVSTVACKMTNGSAVSTVPVSYANEPGINNFYAYLVQTCSTTITGVNPSAIFSMTVSTSGGGIIRPPPENNCPPNMFCDIP